MNVVSPIAPRYIKGEAIGSIGGGGNMPKMCMPEICIEPHEPCMSLWAQEIFKG